MTTPTDKELRELDAWIGVNVFGMKAIHRDGPQPTRGIEDDYFVIEFIHISHSLPFYSTNPSDAMAVLKKCAEKRVRVFVHFWSGDWFVSDGEGVPVTAETLELAICLFAKQIFGKEK